MPNTDHQEPFVGARIVVASLLPATRWEWMLEKAAEIGADRIIPVLSDRSVVRLSTSDIDEKLARWSQILTNSARQCERHTQVCLDSPTTLRHAIDQLPNTHRLMLDERQPTHPWPHIEPGEPVALFVGPERGWTDEERALLLEAKITPCGLGHNLLRAETASIVALAMLRARDHGLL